MKLAPDQINVFVRTRIDEDGDSVIHKIEFVGTEEALQAIAMSFADAVATGKGKKNLAGAKLRIRRYDPD